MTTNPALTRALTRIAEYTDKLVPATLPDAKHMLVMINIIARETLSEEDHVEAFVAEHRKTG